MASRLCYYNPLSQNSEHGLPTERRDREVDWSEVTGQDQIIDQDRKTVGTEGGAGWNGGTQKWRLRTGDLTRGNNTAGRASGEGLLHGSNPVLLSGFRDERETVPQKRERVGLLNCSTLGAELWVSSTYDCAIRLVWLVVTWGKGPLVQIFLHGFPCFTGCPGREEWHSKLYFCSCFLLLGMPNTKRTYEQGCRHPRRV